MRKIPLFVASLVLCTLVGCSTLGLTHNPGSPAQGTPGEPGYVPATSGSVTVTGLQEPWNSLLIAGLPLLTYLGGRKTVDILGTTAKSAAAKPA